VNGLTIGLQTTRMTGWLSADTAAHSLALAPVNASWGQENRTVAIRVKGLAGAGLHTENRVPCGASNPYLVGVAAIAADPTTADVLQYDPSEKRTASL
jgi:Glutamine synthetase, catalytic domain